MIFTIITYSHMLVPLIKLPKEEAMKMKLVNYRGKVNIENIKNRILKDMNTIWDPENQTGLFHLQYIF